MKKFKNKGIGKRLLGKYNFIETSILEGVYRDNRIEYFLMRINDESIDVNKTKIYKKYLKEQKYLN